MATVQIPNHAHCAICQRAIAAGDKACSSKCEEQLEDINKRRRRMMYMMYGLMAIAVVFLLLPLAQR